MTKLEEEIWTAIMKVEDNQEDENFFDIDSYSKAAAGVAKKYIRIALNWSWENEPNLKDLTKEELEIKYYKWLKDNGIYSSIGRYISKNI